jgi:hypothetical protein
MTANIDELGHLTVAAEDAPTDAEALEGFAHQGFEWLNDIACKDLEATEFFARAGHVLGDEAKKACLETCEVWRECTIFSYLGHGGQLITGGYFAGLSPGQRKKMTLSEALEHGEKLRERRAARI